MDRPRDYILSEVSQIGKGNVIWYHLFVESKIQYKSTEVWNKNTDTENSLVFVGVGREGLGTWSSRGDYYIWDGETRPYYVAQGTTVNVLWQTMVKKYIYAISFPGDLPDSGIKPGSLHCRQTLYRLSHPAAAAKPLQSCPTLCDPRDGSPPGSPVPGIL